MRAVLSPLASSWSSKSSILASVPRSVPMMMKTISPRSAWHFNGAGAGKAAFQNPLVQSGCFVFCSFPFTA
jgi:hypothetical protein